MEQFVVFGSPHYYGAGSVSKEGGRSHNPKGIVAEAAGESREIRSDERFIDGVVEVGNPALGVSARAEAMKVAVKSANGYFGPSLRSRESVDFLLTPAFLLQEAISDNILITYPEE